MHCGRAYIVFLVNLAQATVNSSDAMTSFRQASIFGLSAASGVRTSEPYIPYFTS